QLRQLEHDAHVRVAAHLETPGVQRTVDDLDATEFRVFVLERLDVGEGVSAERQCAHVASLRGRPRPGKGDSHPAPGLTSVAAWSRGRTSNGSPPRCRT